MCKPTLEQPLFPTRSPSANLGPFPVRTFAPQPPLPFSASALVVNAAGELAAVTGAVPLARAAGPMASPSAGALPVNRYGLAVLELTPAPPSAAAAAARGSGSAQGGPGTSASEPPVACVARGGGDGGALLLPIGASVMRMAWHPLSDQHLLVLLSDGSLRMYAASRGAALALEQEWLLCPAGAPAGGALRPPLPPDPPAVDFGFFAQHGWGAASIVILFRDGALRALCPVLPWGALLSAPLAASFFAADATTEQWLQAALPPARPLQPNFTGSGLKALRARPSPGGQGTPSGTPSGAGAAQGMPPPAAGMVRVAPAALPAAAPALQGPFLSDSDGEPPAALGHAVAMAVAPLSTARTDGGAVVVVAHAARLRAYLLPEAPAPRWARTAVSTERSLDGTLRKARMSAIGSAQPDQGAAAQRCIPIDDIELQGPAGGTRAAAGGQACSLTWEGLPERRLFVRSGGKVHAVTFPWLSAVERLLADGTSADGPDQFPMPIIQTVVDSAELIAAVLLRDPLCEGSLLALGPGGEVKFAVAEPLPPQQAQGSAEGGGGSEGAGGLFGGIASPLGSPLRPTTPPGGSAATPPAAHAVGALVSLIEGPDKTPPVASASGPADSIEAQQALAEAAAALRLRYVRWAHRAHEDVGIKAAELGTEGARQVMQLDALQEKIDVAARRSEEVERRLKGCQALHENLRDRARLLGDLARDRPRKLSEEERAVAVKLRGAWNPPAKPPLSLERTQHSRGTAMLPMCLHSPHACISVCVVLLQLTLPPPALSIARARQRPRQPCPRPQRQARRRAAAGGGAGGRRGRRRVAALPDSPRAARADSGGARQGAPQSQPQTAPRVLLWRCSFA